MVVLAKQSDPDQAVNLATISRITEVSRRYLEQLAISLRTYSLVRGVTGRNGGYMLTRPPERISVGEIVEAAIGPINIVHCVLDRRSCTKAQTCACRKVYCRINDGINDVLEGITLAELAGVQEGAPHSAPQRRAPTRRRRRRK